MSLTSMRSIKIAGILLALVTLWMPTASGQKLEKLQLAYSVPVSGSDTAFLFAGQQLGFFKEQGIDLEIQTTQGTVASTVAFGKLHAQVAKNPKLEQAMWQERLKLHVLPPEAKGQMGYMAREHFENLLDVLYGGGAIKDKPPVEKL